MICPLHYPNYLWKVALASEDDTKYAVIDFENTQSNIRKFSIFKSKSIKHSGNILAKGEIAYVYTIAERFLLHVRQQYNLKKKRYCLAFNNDSVIIFYFAA